jgi:hypothetical protein
MQLYMDIQATSTPIKSKALNKEKYNTPPEVEGANAEEEPARAAITASFIMVSVRVEMEQSGRKPQGPG